MPAQSTPVLNERPSADGQERPTTELTEDLELDTASEERRDRRYLQGFRLTVWFFGVVIASLIPLASSYMAGVDVNEAPSWVTWLGHGDLLITGPVVAVAGFVELALSYKSIKADKLPSIIILITSGVVVIVAQAVWYGDVSASLLGEHRHLALETIAVGSVACYIASVLCGCVGVVLSGVD